MKALADAARSISGSDDAEAQLVSAQRVMDALVLQLLEEDPQVFQTQTARRAPSRPRPAAAAPNDEDLLF